MKTITVEDSTWAELTSLKLKLKVKTLDLAINSLLEKKRHG